MFIFRNFVFLCLFVSASQNSVFSESLKPSNLDPITVIGSRLDQKLSKTITSTSVYTKDEIKRSGSKSIADFLQGELSIEVGRSGGLGSQTSFFLRGAESRNVLIFVDGVRVRDNITQSALAENIPLALINRIEIVRGNVSSLYGDGAIGGAIFITTNLSNKSLDAFSNKSVNSEFGDFNTKDLSFNYNFRSKEGLGLYFAAQHLKSDGFSASNPQKTFSIDPTDKDNDAHENNSLIFGINKSINNLVFGAKFYGTRAKTMFDNSFLGNDPRQNADHHLVNLFAEVKLSDMLISKIDYGISEINLSYNYGDFFKTEQKQISILNTLDFGTNKKIIFGYENRDQKRNPASSGLSERQINSIFLGYIADFDKISIQFNIRNDDAADVGSELTHLFGASYQLDDKKAVFFNVSTAFGIPTAYALSTNPFLIPENHDSHEMGFKYLTFGSAFTITFFENNTTNPITYDPSEGYIAKNFKSFKNNGVELLATKSLNNHDLKFSWTFQDPLSPNGLNPNEFIQSARRAKSFGSIAYVYSFDNFSFNLKGISSSNRKDSDYSSRMLSKYFIFNGGIDYKIKDNLKLSLKVMNLTNSNYELAYGYNNIPRFFSIGLSLFDF